MARAAGLLAAAFLLEAGPVEAVTFTDVTATAGIAYTQHALGPGPLFETQWMTGGAAVGDVDGDGDVDLFATRLDDTDRLYLNQGNGTFVEGSAGAGLTLDLQTNGAAFADIDNDGDLDLFVTTIRETRYLLYVNDGTGHFTEEAAARGADLDDGFPNAGQSVAVADCDGDGWLDLHVSEWSPVARHARLLRNRGAVAPGHFDDVTLAADVDLSMPVGLGSGVYSFTSRFADFDRDGRPDLAIAADFGTSRLFWNDGDGTFTDGTAAAGVGTEENGMGSAIGDVDGDGWLDWFVTSIRDPIDVCGGGSCNWGTTGNRLYRNLGNRTFADVTDARGVRDGRWGWGAAFFDFDNDGDLDLTMANGQQFGGPGGVVAPYNSDPQRLWRNDGAGAMAEIAAASGAALTTPGKGLLVFDYDDDGDLDLLVSANGAAPALLRNDGGNAGHWLRVRVETNGGTRDAVGARIEVIRAPGEAPMVRELGGGPHFLSQSETVAHFGLGAHAGPVHSVSVTPTGATMPWIEVTGVAGDQTLALELPAAAPLPGPPAWLVAAALALAGALCAGARPRRPIR